ncbi:YegP family protein [Hydrogenophaga sp. UC242_50]|jgi:uncharacterized protein YegP (UPF0339 family)|uniref:YegP family protein n=1 Tax=unclassified Hydrogenophaga TaxID=2610897 RepID=UPI0036D367F3
MAAYFHLKPSGTQWMFNLVAGNHEIILTSERYTAKQSAQGGIASVQANAPVDARYARLNDAAGKPYFVLKAANGEPLGKSETYSSAAARDQGIEAVKAAAPGAPTKA